MGIVSRDKYEDSKETKALDVLTQSLHEGFESEMLLVYLVWVTDRMVLSMEVEPQQKDWVQEERKLDLRHVELESTLDNISRFPVGSFVCFLFVLFCFSIRVC